MNTESEKQTNRTELACADCGNNYPIGGDKNKHPTETSPERAEHHAQDCPIRDALKQRGQTTS